jgi:hypothetical protein
MSSIVAAVAVVAADGTIAVIAVIRPLPQVPHTWRASSSWDLGKPVPRRRLLIKHSSRKGPATLYREPMHRLIIRTSIILWCQSLGDASGIDLGGQWAIPSSNRRALGLIASFAVSRRRPDPCPSAALEDTEEGSSSMECSRPLPPVGHVSSCFLECVPTQC